MAKKEEDKPQPLETVKDREETVIINNIDAEYEQGKENNSLEDTDFEAYLDMYDNVRAERNYDWQSDLAIPEFLNHIQDQSADEANAYFARKEFVNVTAQSVKPEDIASARSAKEYIDKNLSRTSMHFFQKYMRMTETKNIGGRTYARCWWDQEIKEREVEVPSEFLSVDEQGFPIRETETERDIIRDHFDFDVVDPRNIKSSGEYTYNIADKNWTTLRFDTTLNKLERSAKQMGYFNLDKLENIHLSGETETKRETSEFDLRGDSKKDADRTPVKDLMVVERYGLDYAVVTEKDEDGEPIEIEFGYDENGDVKDSAELVRLIQAVAYTEQKKVLIRHQLTPYIDSRGNRYLPLIEFLCYIHPTKDRGFGDGVGSRDLQTAINDTFNANNDNTLLGMLKIIKVPAAADQDEMPLRIEPMAIWPEGADVIDFPSNTVPALNQMQFLTQKMSQTNAREPGIPILSSAAATTVARAEKQVNVRSQYKALVFENTGMKQFYWMQLQMANQFMLPETAMEMLGEEHALNFNADLDYIYKPVSEAIESDATKGAKIDRLNTMLGYVINSPNPQAPAVANKIVGQIFRLMGKEEEEISSGLFDESVPFEQPGGDQGATPSLTSPAQSSVNQTGLPQPTSEASAVGATL